MHQIITLPNGVRIVTEKIPGVRTAALGIYVGAGSRHETAGESGAAHFIEHMTFKGTARRTARELAMEMDALGGHVNAYTTKESTCFHLRCLDRHLDRGIDLLCDMFFCSRFAQEDLVTERGVILEEIGMYEDTPDDLCSERLAAAVYRGSPLARPILGRKGTLERLDGERLRAWRDGHYSSRAVVVALAGSFTRAAVAELKERFSALPDRPAPAARRAAYAPAWTARRKAIEQNHLTLAFPAPAWDDPRRYELMLLTDLLGGGMSSRLFQEVREKRGLCYSVYSYYAGHADTGLLGIYTALGRETEARALDTILGEVDRLADRGPAPDELDRTREQAKAGLLMGLESVQARMGHLGRSLLLMGRVPGTEELLEAYDAVTPEGVRQLARELFDRAAMSLSAVGRVDPAEEYRARLGR